MHEGTGRFVQLQNRRVNSIIEIRDEKSFCFAGDVPRWDTESACHGFLLTINNQQIIYTLRGILFTRSDR